MIREWALKKAKAIMASRPPDFEIGLPEARSVQRWIVGPWGIYERGSKPKNWWDGLKRRLPNLYFHKWLNGDADRVLHDHPWWSCSWLLENGYWETLFYPISDARIAELLSRGEARPTVKVWRPEGSTTFRAADAAHKVTLETRPGRLGRAENVEVISAFFTGFAVRPWGFLCDKRWVPWQEFVSARDRGAVGKGCGD